MNSSELTLKDVNEILEEQKEFFGIQATKKIEFRINQLKKLKESIKDYESKITEALSLDLGKHEFESYVTEIGFIYLSIENTINNLKKWAKPKKTKTPIFLKPGKSYIVSEPYGSVLIIGPYNYPFQLVIEPLIGAISAGNCIVIKPSEISLNVSNIITEMISKTFDKKYISCVEGSVKTNISLINSQFDYIFFTGSVNVGKIIMKAAAQNLIPVTLELGGKSPVIVDETANIKISAQRIIWGKTLNAGQTCVAPDYLMVSKNIKGELIKEMKNAIKEFFGDNVKSSEYYGRIINDKHFNRIKNLIDRDKKGILYGGTYDEHERFIEPTIIDVSEFESESMKEEIFGPVLPIIEFVNFDDVVMKIKSMPKPLALYIFTNNKKTQERVIEEIPSGGVCINDTLNHLANSNLPFGGVGNAGIGAYHGEESFKTFSHRKSVLNKGAKINIKMLFPPYSSKNMILVKKLLN
ncbi:aldehyde dehydrogenase [Clostridium beijerinckii]|uniref:Aldehyde dehydrogenase n=1 Tax=Clostridium beijerinckii TaxID=1520 RepID=A0A1S9MYP8_CLOBE|nr:aldehyde dehydrogenase [Clostridium beijerinckii]MZK54047.1 aldehyde dehydrogenase family protein [Clostridium beijerinckii]MZK62131.1 aldehyde dehydrogenase family protein [Clostridium beijerinckii]MZK72348.1 aldehyde dehydrogenase family protein [Clostridium beijerinckii]MZK77742.1 aldehyde dehydrogenase family protein [Clostridium beijerinckii]MZK87317.1 aldehyde dehydrogenase family protein [Clostridium beijerinckii]